MSVRAYCLRMLMNSLTLSAVLAYKCRWHFCTTIYLCLLLFAILSLPSQLWCCPVTVFLPWQFLLAAAVVHLWWDCEVSPCPHPSPDLSSTSCIALCFSCSCSLDSVRNMLEYLSSLMLSSPSTHFCYTCLTGVKRVYLTKLDVLDCPRTGFTETQKLLKRNHTGFLGLCKFINCQLSDVKSAWNLHSPCSGPRIRYISRLARYHISLLSSLTHQSSAAGGLEPGFLFLSPGEALYWVK